jgi:hypothetical protein
MKKLMPSLFVSAALAGLLAATASADHHEGKKEGHHKHDKSKKEKKGKGHAKKAGADDDKVHCLGINACKGKSECGVEGGHGCAGHNACKGKGWVTLTRKECADQKGTVHGEKAAPAAAEAPETPMKDEKAAKGAEKPAEKGKKKH